MRGSFLVVASAVLLSASPTAQQARVVMGQPAPGLRFGRVLTAASVRAWGDYVARDSFTPGARVWVYAETLGTARERRVDIAFHFVVTASDGRQVFDTKAEFAEETSSPNWGAWRWFDLPARAALGDYRLTVEVVNRLTGDKGARDASFKVVSAATTMAAIARGGAPDADEPEATEPLSPEMEEAFALLGQRQYDEAVRVFRKALGKEKTSTRGWWGLARAYEGLNAYKNVLESCDRLLECSQAPRFQAIAHNLKGVALFTRAGDRDPPVKADLVEAERELRAALAADGSLHIARYNLGTVLLKGGNDAAGTDELRAYVAAAPTGTMATEAARLIENPRRARETFAPDFSVVTTEGEHLDLEGLKGKVVVVDFWASWCQPCEMAIPLLKTVRKRFPADRVVMISVSLDTDAGAWRAAMNRQKMPWHQVLDSSGRMARLFGVRPIPSTFVLDGDGVIRKQVVGYTTSFANLLEDAIGKALKPAAPR